MSRTTLTLATVVLASVAALASAAAQDHPDLSGLWADGVVPEEVFGQSGAGPGSASAGGTFLADEQDSELRERGSLNRPPYKPEFWGDVRTHDIYGTAGGEWSDLADPAWQDRPLGVPRMGPPSKIVEKDGFVTLLYFHDNLFRDIPTDCRPHNPDMSIDISYMGHAVGCWEGDRLVVTSKGFTDETWLDSPGQIHSLDMEVIETFRRDGDALFYDVTVIDPVMFSKPWVLDTRTLTLDTRPGAVLLEQTPLIDRALGVPEQPTDPS